MGYARRVIRQVAAVAPAIVELLPGGKGAALTAADKQAAACQGMTGGGTEPLLSELLCPGLQLTFSGDLQLRSSGTAADCRGRPSSAADGCGGCMAAVAAVAWGARRRAGTVDG